VAAPCNARPRIASVMSTPMARPVGPVCRAASRRSVPAPHPISSTVDPMGMRSIACGFPTPAKEDVTSAGSAASSVASYPNIFAAYSGPRWKWKSPAGDAATREYIVWTSVRRLATSKPIGHATATGPPVRTKRLSDSLANDHRAANRVQVLSTNSIRVLWTRGNVGEHQLKKGVPILGRERAIESPLETDRGRRLAAEAPATDRPGKRARPDFNVIRQRAEPGGALEERGGADLGARRKLRPSHVAHHQGMPGEDEPGFGTSRPIGDEQRHMLGRVTGRVEDVNPDVADGQLLTIFQAHLYNAVDRLVHAIRRTRRLGQCAAAGTMIRMHVRINHMHDAHPRVP